MSGRADGYWANVPEYFTADEIAVKLGWSAIRTRSVARRAGIGFKVGAKTFFTHGDIHDLENIANGKAPDPPAIKTTWCDAHVYFFQQPGFIKIGWSKNWRKRLVTIQLSTPQKINVLATYRGGRPMEQRLHEMFAAHRATGEWFREHPDILAFIEQNLGKCCKEAKTQK